MQAGGGRAGRDCVLQAEVVGSPRTQVAGSAVQAEQVAGRPGRQAGPVSPPQTQ